LPEETYGHINSAFCDGMATTVTAAHHLLGPFEEEEEDIGIASDVAKLRWRVRIRPPQVII